MIFVWGSSYEQVYKPHKLGSLNPLDGCRTQSSWWPHIYIHISINCVYHTNTQTSQTLGICSAENCFFPLYSFFRSGKPQAVSLKTTGFSLDEGTSPSLRDQWCLGANRWEAQRFFGVLWGGISFSSSGGDFFFALKTSEFFSEFLSRLAKTRVEVSKRQGSVGKTSKELSNRIRLCHFSRWWNSTIAGLANELGDGAFLWKQTYKNFVKRLSKVKGTTNHIRAIGDPQNLSFAFWKP